MSLSSSEIAELRNIASGTSSTMRNPPGIAGAGASSRDRALTLLADAILKLDKAIQELEKKV